MPVFLVSKELQAEKLLVGRGRQEGEIHRVWLCSLVNVMFCGCEIEMKGCWPPPQGGSLGSWCRDECTRGSNRILYANKL